MKKKSSSRSKQSRNDQKVNKVNFDDLLYFYTDNDILNRVALDNTAPLRDLVQFDYRRFDPTRRFRRLLNIKQQVSSLTTRGFFDKLSFKLPRFEPVCIRRKLRRKVLFALKLTVKGSGAKRHKFTENSKISCR